MFVMRACLTFYKEVAANAHYAITKNHLDIIKILVLEFKKKKKLFCPQH